MAKTRKSYSTPTAKSSIFCIAFVKHVVAQMQRCTSPIPLHPYPLNSITPTFINIYYRDLAEEATGIVQFLPSNLHERTSSLLPTPKTTYVLVRIQSMFLLILSSLHLHTLSHTRLTSTPIHSHHFLLLTLQLSYSYFLLSSHNFAEGEDGSMEYVPMMDMGRSNFLGIFIYSLLNSSI